MNAQQRRRKAAAADEIAQWRKQTDNGAWGSECISMKEITDALQHTNKSAAPGADRITGKMLQKGGKVITSALHVFLNATFKYEVTPSHFVLDTVVPIYKGKGSRYYAKSYRPVSLMSIVAKIYQRIIYDRVQDGTKSLEAKEGSPGLSPAQMGSRKGKDRLSLIYTMLGAVRARAVEGKATYIAQADIEGAFPSASKETTDHEMWTTHNIRGKIWRVIRSLEQGERGTIRINGRNTYEETHDDGFSQGGIHAGHRFLFSIDPLFREIQRTEQGATVQGPDGQQIDISVLGYVDDTFLLATSAENLQHLLTKSEEVAREKSFSWSPDKTNIMVANPPKNRRKRHTWNHAGRQGIPYENQMTVLGEKVSTNAYRNKTQVQDTIKRAAAAARTLEWMGAYEEGMTPELVEILFNALVQSVLTSGLSVSSMTEKEWEQVDTIKANVARRYLHVGERASVDTTLMELGWESPRIPIIMNKIRTVVKILRGSAGSAGVNIARTRILHAENGDTQGPIVEAWAWTQKVTGGLTIESILDIKEEEVKANLNQWKRRWRDESNKISHQKEQNRRAEAGEATLAERKTTRAAKAAPPTSSQKPRNAERA